MVKERIEKLLRGEREEPWNFEGRERRIFQPFLSFKPPISEEI
jgi:hypothetical protein